MQDYVIVFVFVLGILWVHELKHHWEGIWFSDSMSTWPNFPVIVFKWGGGLIISYSADYVSFVKEVFANM